MQVESAKISGLESPVYPTLPNFPTENDIVTKAESLNYFVSQTTPQPEVKTTKKNS